MLVKGKLVIFMEWDKYAMFERKSLKYSRIDAILFESSIIKYFFDI